MARELFPWALILSLAVALGFGFFSRLAPRLGRTSQWVFGSISWLMFVAAIGVAITAIVADSGPLLWTTDFFSLVPSGGAVRLGFEATWVNVLACCLIALIYGHAFLLEPFSADSPSSREGGGRWGVVQSGSCLGMLAVGLAWLSSGLWAALLAQALATCAGWVILSSLAKGKTGDAVGFAGAALSYIRERSLGLILVATGAAISAATGDPMDWRTISEQSAWSAGLVLIFFGSVFQLQLFPAVGWNIRTRDLPPLSARAQLLIGNPSTWVAFAILYKISKGSHEFNSLQLPVALVLTLLTGLSALGVRQVQSAFGLFAAALVGMSVAILPVVDARVSGTFFFTAQLSLWSASLFMRSPGRGQLSAWLERALAAVLVLSVFGGPGFASAAVLLAAAGSANSIPMVGLLLVCWALLALGFMRLLATPVDRVSAEVEDKLGVAEGESWAWRVVPVVLSALLSLSIFWCGDILGNFVSAESAVGPNWSSLIFGVGHTITDEAFQPLSWGWMFVVALLISLGIPLRLARAELRFLRFAAEGYGVGRALSFLESIGRLIIERLSRVLNGNQLALFVALPQRGFHWVCQWLLSLDRRVVDLLDRCIRSVIEIPAKGLQLMQAGSVQLYLLFTVGFALAMLLHFLGQIKN